MTVSTAAKKNQTSRISKEVIAPAAMTKKPDKREAIIEAATALFTTEGYETTTIAQVAKRAGVAVGTVYLYFKNKQEMLYAVKDDWDSDFVKYMLQEDMSAIPHVARIRPLIEACFKACAQQTERVQLLGLSPQVVGEMYQGKGLDKSSPHMQQMIKLWLEQAMAEGAFRPMNAEVAATFAYKTVSGMLEECFNANSNCDQQAYIDVLVDAFERWLVRPELLKA